MIAPASRTLLRVNGMRDNNCRVCVVAALQAVAGVREVYVTLFRATATIVHEPPCSVSDLVAEVFRAGYCADLIATTEQLDTKGT
jgi:hypothetical protein